MLKSAISLSGNSQFTLAAKMCRALWKKLNSGGNWEVFKTGSSCLPAQMWVAMRWALYVTKNHKISEDGVGTCQCLSSWQKNVAVREDIRKEQEHIKTEVGKCGPEVGVNRAYCPQHQGSDPGLLSGTCQIRAGAAARAGQRLEVSPGLGQSKAGTRLQCAWI